jgi:hypothetical protein
MQPIQTTRPAAVSRLCKQIDRAFDRREYVTLGSHEYTYRQKGEELESESAVYEALASGVYQKTPVYKDIEAPPIDHRFMHFGSRDDIESIVNRVCAELTYNELEEITVGLVARAVLKSMNPDRRKVHEAQDGLGL